MATATAPTFDKGLANTVAAETQMSFIDGGKGVLEYVGIDIDSLARNSTFEETVYLLWNLKLPTKVELDAFCRELRAEYMLPAEMAGGPENPLGARAMYIGGKIYRIHGTNAPGSIGTAASSGCIRMMNADVIELYEKVKIGAKVYVYQ